MEVRTSGWKKRKEEGEEGRKGGREGRRGGRNEGGRKITVTRSHGIRKYCRTGTKGVGSVAWGKARC